MFVLFGLVMSQCVLTAKHEKHETHDERDQATSCAYSLRVVMISTEQIEVRAEKEAQWVSMVRLALCQWYSTAKESQRSGSVTKLAARDLLKQGRVSTALHEGSRVS